MPTGTPSPDSSHLIITRRTPITAVKRRCAWVGIAAVLTSKQGRGEVTARPKPTYHAHLRVPSARSLASPDQRLVRLPAEPSSLRVGAATGSLLAQRSDLDALVCPEDGAVVGVEVDQAKVLGHTRVLPRHRFED